MELLLTIMEDIDLEKYKEQINHIYLNTEHPRVKEQSNILLKQITREQQKRNERQSKGIK